MSAPTLDNAHPMGSGCPTASGVHSVYGDCDCAVACRFKILEPGVWAEIADEFGNKEKLMEYMMAARAVSWREILRLFGNKSLMLRARLFAVAVGARPVAAPAASAVRCTLDPEATDTVTYEIPRDRGSGTHLQITVGRGGAAQAGGEAGILALYRAAVPGSAVDDDVLKRIYGALAPLSPGMLKAAMQKAARYGAESVRLWDAELVPAPEYAAVACALLAAHPGGFVPQIQRVVRGVVSALKRVGVILIEDAYAGTPGDLQALFGAALVCQHVRAYHPPAALVARCVHLIHAAVRSPRVINWRPYVTADGGARSETPEPKPKRRRADAGAPSPPSPPSDGVVAADVTEADAARLAQASELLDELRSFGGDLAMMRTVGRLASGKRGALTFRMLPGGGGPPAAGQPVSIAAPPTPRGDDGYTRPAVMPECHIVDQHAQRGVAHPMHAPRLTSFAARFKAVFELVTGANPRLDYALAAAADAAAGAASSDVVAATRFAQRCVMRFLQPEHYPRSTLKVVASEVLACPIDAGTLAAGVGPIPVDVKYKKRKKLALYVVLPTMLPAGGAAAADEVVMLQPTRGNVEDYLAWGKKDDAAEAAACEEERRLARAAARAKPRAVRSPLLPTGKTAVYKDGQWHFDGKPWAEWVQQGQSVTVDHHRLPYWAARHPQEPLPAALFEDDAAVMDALCCVGTGFCPGAKELVLAVAALAPPAVVARAHSLLRHRYDRFSLPVPDLNGGLGLDQLQAYPNDWAAWRLLVLWSRVAPGALRPAVPPRFDVPNAVLLSALTSWLAGRQHTTDGGGNGDNPWQGKAAWRDAYAKADSLLRVHQRDAVGRMQQRHRRGAPGHYLVMDTGHGKTLTALTYAMWRLLHTDLGKRVKRILWVTPPGERLDKSGKAKANDPRNYQLIQSLLDEFTPPEALVEVPVSFVEKRSLQVDAFTVGILHHDNIRSMPELLTAAAADSFLIFDEGDNFYGPSQRTSMALRLASLCPEFIIQTATPVPTKGKIDRLADWLGLTEEYPVTRQNYLVAACNMVALKISLGIESKYSEHALPRTAAAEAAFGGYMRTRDWRALFKVLQSECNAGFCDRAAHYAATDRAANSDGGCFVVCETDRHVKDLCALFRARHPAVPCGDARAMDDGAVAVVFVAAANNRGYNTGVRLGVQIRQPYPGSGAGRQQMEGRIRRMTQKRRVVQYEVVYMAHTLLALLFERQQRDDSVNHSLEQLAEEYDRSVIDFNTPAAAAKKAKK
eukprot:TRINITY_DN24883_c0_g1_i1.p1 TRINITY_DN24883_c0_g1~~TRINITY_DN24883_c0_g1_i1.p1  ORF type:complete len:1390 (+),score=554.89 TRINITY_DN24883_c0_g1_i1:425-4171(+)